MINLYYIQASGSVLSSVTVVPGDIAYKDSSIAGTLSTYPTYYDAILTITASAYETSGSTYTSTVGTLRAYIISGSNIFASFPLENVNIFYNTPYINPQNPLPANTSFASLETNFTFGNVDGDYITSGQYGYFISSSNMVKIYLSGSDATSNFKSGITSDINYIIAISQSISTPSFNLYTSSLSIYDSTLGEIGSSIYGTLITINSGSTSTVVSASFYPTASHTYIAVMNISP